MRLAWSVLWLILMIAGCSPKHDAAGNPIRPLAGIGTSSDEAARVRGVVKTGDVMLPTPVQFVVVELVQADTVIRETSTDHDGRFVFTGDIAQGSYEARVGGAYIGATKVVLSETGTEQVTIQATPR